MIDRRKAVFIEYCVNCNNHAWCTKHDEGKYHHFFVLIKDEIEREYKNLTVHGNVNHRTGKPIIPKLGAFEITFKDRSVFSKLKTTLWPAVDVVLKRMRNVMEGRDFSDIGANDNTILSNRQQVNSKNQAALRKIINRNKTSHNQSFMSPDQEQRSIIRERQEHSMMELIDEDREEYLPKINGGGKQREYTPSRLEGVGQRYMERSSSRQYVRLAYLDGDKRIVHVPRDTGFSQRKLMARDSGSWNDHFMANNSYYSNTKYGTAAYLDQSAVSIRDYHTENGSASKKDSMGSLHRGRSHRMDYQPIEHKKMNEMRHGSGSVPVSRRNCKEYRPDGQSEQEHEVHESSVLTEKSKRTEESEQSSAIRKREATFDGNEGRTANQQLLKGLEIETLNSASVIPQMMNQSTNTGPDEVVCRKIPQVKDVVELYKMDYPEQKLSEIQIAKNRTTRKKITLAGDENEDCKVNVYSTIPDILAPESSEIMVSKGAVFKIGLKFEHVEGKRGQDCCLFVFKNDQPWQKIVIKGYYNLQ